MDDHFQRPLWLISIMLSKLTTVLENDNWCQLLPPKKFEKFWWKLKEYNPIVEIKNLPEHFSTSIAVVGYMFMLYFHMGCQRWRTWIIFATVFTLQNFQWFVGLKSSFFDFLTQMQSFDMIFHVPTIVEGFTTVWT